MLLYRKEGNVLFNDALIWKEGNVLFNDACNTFYLWFYGRKEGNVLFNDALIWKEGNVLFNDALNTFYLLYRNEMFGLTMHATHFICGYMEGRKCFIKRRTQHILFTVIWRQTYGRGPLR